MNIKFLACHTQRNTEKDNINPLIAIKFFFNQQIVMFHVRLLTADEAYYQVLYKIFQICHTAPENYFSGLLSFISAIFTASLLHATINSFVLFALITAISLTAPFINIPLCC